MPSGTSRELAETLAQVREPAVTVPLADLHGPAEARGAQVAGTRIHSVRLPSFVVTTEVVFGGPDERLIMRHDPGMTPAPYVSGSLLAVRKVADVAGVRRGLDSLLFAELAPDLLCGRLAAGPPSSRLSCLQVIGACVHACDLGAGSCDDRRIRQVIGGNVLSAPRYPALCSL